MPEAGGHVVDAVDRERNPVRAPGVGRCVARPGESVETALAPSGMTIKSLCRAHLRGFTERILHGGI
ncbi:hypothetical protein GA0115255_101063 [Streptomyces sp. Ncost-T6T-2b]|nr:hypothetical protein GA0115255_101063 [Streptomyces sp. Ncost-T6T-2b]